VRLSFCTVYDALISFLQVEKEEQGFTKPIIKLDNEKNSQ
jgi:hypothetical protein